MELPCPARCHGRSGRFPKSQSATFHWPRAPLSALPHPVCCMHGGSLESSLNEATTHSESLTLGGMHTSHDVGTYAGIHGELDLDCKHPGWGRDSSYSLYDTGPGPGPHPPSPRPFPRSLRAYPIVCCASSQAPRSVLVSRCSTRARSLSRRFLPCPPDQLIPFAIAHRFFLAPSKLQVSCANRKTLSDNGFLLVCPSNTTLRSHTSKSTNVRPNQRHPKSIDSSLLLPTSHHGAVQRHHHCRVAPGASPGR